MKPLNGPAGQHAIPVSHPEARAVPPSSASASTAVSPSRYPEAASVKDATSRAEPRIEPRPPPLSSDMRIDGALLLAAGPRAEPRSEPRTEARPEARPDTARSLGQALNLGQALKQDIERACEREPLAKRQHLHEQRQDRPKEQRAEQRPPSRSDSRPEQRPEKRQEQRQEQRQRQEPVPQQTKNLPADPRCEPPADPGQLLEEVDLPGTVGQPAPDRQPRPPAQQQRMASKPPLLDSEPAAPSMPPPDLPWRSGPILLQLPSLPSPERVPGEEGMSWPGVLAPSLPPSLQGTGLPPRAADFYPSLRDAMGNTLLMLACRAGHAELLAYLLESCPLAYAQALDVFGRNAAMIARDSGHPALLALLQQAGVELTPENPALQWYLQNRGDLAMASRAQDWQPLASILAQDHFMNLRDANGRTLIFHAVMNADLEAVRFLCGCLDTPFVGWKDVYGNSVFRYTTRIPNVETGAAICQELRAVRRRARWQRKRAPWRRNDDDGPIVWSEPGWRDRERDGERASE